MFVQVIRAKTDDPDAVRAAGERWQRELKPGATGFLGATTGVAGDGTVVNVVRFESAEAARQNADRPEQGAWWESFAEHVTDVEFFDCPDVDLMRGGGSDEAGFVQVLFGRSSDKARSKQLLEEFGESPDLRPDVIGGITCWADDGRFVDVTYFTNEEEARAGEQQGMPADFQERFDQWMSLVEDVAYVDLGQPEFFAP